MEDAQGGLASTWRFWTSSVQNDLRWGTGNRSMEEEDEPHEASPVRLELKLSKSYRTCLKHSPNVEPCSTASSCIQPDGLPIERFRKAIRHRSLFVMSCIHSSEWSTCKWPSLATNSELTINYKLEKVSRRMSQPGALNRIYGSPMQGCDKWAMMNKHAVSVCHNRRWRFELRQCVQLVQSF